MPTTKPSLRGLFPANIRIAEMISFSGRPACLRAFLKQQETSLIGLAHGGKGAETHPIQGASCRIVD
jgi:hypothetical protein